VLLQLPGFVLLVIGTLIYNEILVLPCLGLNQYTKDALKQRKENDELIDQYHTNQDLKNTGVQEEDSDQ
jgi:hypothetical protein